MVTVGQKVKRQRLASATVGVIQHLFRRNCFACARHKREHGDNTSASKSWKLLEMHVGAPSQNALGTQVLARHPLDECL